MSRSALTKRPGRRSGGDLDVRSTLELRSDSRLVRRASAGDEQAFAAIFRRYEQDLYRFCLAILGNREDAQDALQNTMVSALRALPGESRRIELKPWLYRIAHNESIDLTRRRRSAEPLDPELIAGGPDLAREAAARQRLGRLLADLETLPERQRAALVLRELSGLGFEQIATAIGSSAAVARQTVYEARLSLRQIEAGREMDCDAVTRAISDADGRVLRRRDIRAHLRACSGCQAFEAEIEGRSQALGALAPLPALAAAGLLKGALGGALGAGAAGGSAAGGAAGGALAGGVGGSLVLKAAATVAVVGVLGVGADRAQVVDLGISGGREAPASEERPADDGGAAGRSDARSRPPAGGGAGGGSASPGAGADRRPAAAAALAAPRVAVDGKRRAGSGGTNPSSEAAGRGAGAPDATRAQPRTPPGQANGHGNNRGSGNHGGSPAPAAAKGQQRAAAAKEASHAPPEHSAKPAKPPRPQPPGKTKAPAEPAAPAASTGPADQASDQATAEGAKGMSAEAPGQQGK